MKKRFYFVLLALALILLALPGFAAKGARRLGRPVPRFA
jgi:hypothetical protein